jgi:hypothetical protein
VPAPDVNTNSTVIDWMVDEYENLTGDTSHASFTGKSLGKGGSLGRDSATGRGGVMAFSKLLTALRQRPAKAYLCSSRIRKCRTISLQLYRKKNSPIGSLTRRAIHLLFFMLKMDLTQKR